MTTLMQSTVHASFDVWTESPAQLAQRHERKERDLANRPRPISMLELWDALMAGSFRVVGNLTTETHCYLTLVPATADSEQSRPLQSAKARVFEAAARGRPQKVMAIELGRSISSISGVLAECVNFLGLSCQFRHLPLLLAIAAHARSGNHRARRGIIRTSSDQCLSIVALRRPDETLRPYLSPAEYSVARLVLEGKTHEEMAAVRGVAGRTVANQIQSLFHKLHASGRFELLARALAE